MRRALKSSAHRKIRSRIRSFFARGVFAGKSYPSPAEKLCWSIWKALGFSVKAIVCLMLIGALAQFQYGITVETKQLFGTPGSPLLALMTPIFATVLIAFCEYLYLFNRADKMFPKLWHLGTASLLCTAMFVALSPRIFTLRLDAIWEGLLPFIIAWAIAWIAYKFFFMIGAVLSAKEEQNSAVRAVTIGVQMIESGTTVRIDTKALESLFGEGFPDSIE